MGTMTKNKNKTEIIGFKITRELKEKTIELAKLDQCTEDPNISAYIQKVLSINAKNHIKSILIGLSCFPLV